MVDFSILHELEHLTYQLFLALYGVFYCLHSLDDNCEVKKEK